VIIIPTVIVRSFSNISRTVMVGSHVRPAICVTSEMISVLWDSYAIFIAINAYDAALLLSTGFAT
jgi:hypothetical protein